MKYMVDLRLIWFEFEGTNHDYDLAQDMPPISSYELVDVHESNCICTHPSCCALLTKLTKSPIQGGPSKVVY